MYILLTLLAISLSRMPAEQISKCVDPIAITPLLRPCEAPFAQHIPDKIDCSIIVKRADGSILIKAWGFWGDMTKRMRMDISQEECLCQIWEVFPEYVVWENGNPCPAGNARLEGAPMDYALASRAHGNAIGRHTRDIPLPSSLSWQGLPIVLPMSAQRGIIRRYTEGSDLRTVFAHT